MSKIYASMKSIASYVPSNCINNYEFEKIVDTSDEWIRKRTGIETRYFADNSELSSDLGVKAAKLAISRANMTIDDIDLVLCATLSPDFFTMPSNAAIISHKLGIHNKPAFDISSACSGFIYLLSIAKAYIESGVYKNILIIGAEKISSILDFSDRSTCVLFGDGAGAAVISTTEDSTKAIIDVNINANGKYSDSLFTTRCVGGGLNSLRADSTMRDSSNQFKKDTNKEMESTTFSPLKCESKDIFLQMKGNEIFKLAVRTLANDVGEILEKNNIKSSEIDFFVPHQANLRIINAVGELIDIDSSKIVLTVQKFGNTSAASIPMAIDDIYNNKKLKNGDLLLLDAFGGGLTWGSCLLYFNGR